MKHGSHHKIGGRTPPHVREEAMRTQAIALAEEAKVEAAKEAANLPLMGARPRKKKVA